jgi:hypothetical protein
VCYLGQTINDYPNGVIALLCPGQSCYEVHTNVIPLPHGNILWFQQTGRALMFSLDPSTNVTFSHKFRYVCPHVVPPETVLQVLVHLRAPRVYSVLGIMRLTYYLGMDPLILGVHICNLSSIRSLNRRPCSQSLFHPVLLA